MKNLMTRVALFALLSTAISMAPASTPAFAAQMGTPPVNCMDPAMKNDPSCMVHHKPGPKGGMSTTTTTGGAATTSGGNTTTGADTSTGATTSTGTMTTTSNDNQTNMDRGHKGKPMFCPGGQRPLPNGSCPPIPHGPSNDNGQSGAHGDQPSMGANGFFNFSPSQHDDFRQRFRGFNYGFFPLPGFSITLGTPVPHNYGLRSVPYKIYHYYPQFRGYLYFVARNGDVVIVSPRSHRIVAVL